MTVLYGFLGGVLGGASTVVAVGVALRRALSRSPLAAMMTPPKKVKSAAS